MKAPLEDPLYVPQHPPIDGKPPDVVAKWGARSQVRWFDRFRGQVHPMPYAEWARFYCVSEQHRGLHCDSCLDDKWSGHGDDIDGCCCEALRDARDDDAYWWNIW